MSEQISADNSGTAVADNPVTEPVNGVNGTGTNGGQASEATPAGDLFRGVDPNKLPPDVRPHYDSMLRDYREKTGKLSETTKSEVEKATQAYREKASLYDQIATQEEFVKQWNDYVQKSQSNGQQQEGDPALTQMKQQIQEMNQKIQLSEMAQVTEAFAGAVNEKGEKIHPDFDELNQMHVGNVNTAKGAEPFSLLRAAIELAPGNTPQERLANGYKAAKQLRDSIFEAGKKAGMGRLQTKVLNGTNPPSNSGGEVLSVTDKRPKSAREALEMAKRGQVVSRD